MRACGASSESQDVEEWVAVVNYAVDVTVPTLVVHGERDQRVSVAQATDVYRHLAGPSQMVVVPGVGHEVTEGMTTQDWRDMIAGFLNQVSVAK